MRKIIHIDLDAFYASVEQRDDQRLRGYPVAVGGTGRRGVVMTASYEARSFGVHSAMPTFKALRLCPDLIVVPPRFAEYRNASQALRQIFRSYTYIIEPASLDEAYLDVTTPKSGPGSATAIAEAIRQACLSEIGITASAGISFNKFLAKLASDMNKPNAQTTIRPDEAHFVLAQLPIRRFHGVGPVTSRRLAELGFATGADLQAVTEMEAVSRLGRIGSWVWKLAHGVDNRNVERSRERKSVSVETTFHQNLYSKNEISDVIKNISAELCKRCQNSSFFGRTLTLKIKYADFSITTRSITQAWPITDTTICYDIANRILLSEPLSGPVRLVGLCIHKGSTCPTARQLAMPL